MNVSNNQPLIYRSEYSGNLIAPRFLSDDQIKAIANLARHKVIKIDKSRNAWLHHSVAFEEVQR